MVHLYYTNPKTIRQANKKKTPEGVSFLLGYTSEEVGEAN